MKEGIKRAVTALGVINDYADDERVKKLLKMVLGEGDFDTEVGRVRGKLYNVVIDSPLPKFTKAWNEGISNFKFPISFFRRRCSL